MGWWTRSPATAPRGEEPAGRQVRGFDEILHPEHGGGAWRDLPRLLLASLRLVWSSGRRELVVCAILQLVVAGGAAAQLVLARAVLAAVIRSRDGGFAGVVPSLVAFLVLLLALDLARSVEVEQSRALGELVGRHALDRVIDVAVSVELLAFEDPDSTTGCGVRRRRAPSARSRR